MTQEEIVKELDEAKRILGRIKYLSNIEHCSSWNELQDNMEKIFDLIDDTYNDVCEIED